MPLQGTTGHRSGLGNPQNSIFEESFCPCKERPAINRGLGSKTPLECLPGPKNPPENPKIPDFPLFIPLYISRLMMIKLSWHLPMCHLWIHWLHPPWAFMCFGHSCGSLHSNIYVSIHRTGSLEWSSWAHGTRVF